MGISPTSMPMKKLNGIDRQLTHKRTIDRNCGICHEFKHQRENSIISKMEIWASRIKFECIKRIKLKCCVAYVSLRGFVRVFPMVCNCFLSLCSIFSSKQATCIRFCNRLIGCHSTKFPMQNFQWEKG